VISAKRYQLNKRIFAPPRKKSAYATQRKESIKNDCSGSSCEHSVFIKKISDEPKGISPQKITSTTDERQINKGCFYFYFNLSSV
jgi:hypothetical protein